MGKEIENTVSITTLFQPSNMQYKKEQEKQNSFFIFYYFTGPQS